MLSLGITPRSATKPSRLDVTMIDRGLGWGLQCAFSRHFPQIGYQNNRHFPPKDYQIKQFVSRYGRQGLGMGALWGISIKLSGFLCTSDASFASLQENVKEFTFWGLFFRTLTAG